MSKAPLISANRTSQPVAWVPFALMIAALVLRVLAQHGFIPASFGNFSPLMAFAFAGAIVFPRSLPWWSWAVILVFVDWMSRGSDWWDKATSKPEVLLAYACYAAAALWGGRLRGRAGILDTLVGTLACSVVFYLLTNTMSWWTEVYYTKNLAGWVQALTIGTSGLAPGLNYPTTLEFFRNSLIADLAGAIILVCLYNGEAIARNLRLMTWSGAKGRRLAA